MSSRNPPGRRAALRLTLLGHIVLPRMDIATWADAGASDARTVSAHGVHSDADGRTLIPRSNAHAPLLYPLSSPAKARP